MNKKNRKKLKNSIKNHNISFLGEKNADELPFYYSKSTFCIFPSQFENCPLVGLEAMACGAIVIASATGFEEYIDNKIDGYIIKDLEPEKIKRLIYDLSSNIPHTKAIFIVCGESRAIISLLNFPLAKSIFGVCGDSWGITSLPDFPLTKAIFGVCVESRTIISLPIFHRRNLSS